MHLPQSTGSSPLEQSTSVPVNSINLVTVANHLDSLQPQFCEKSRSGFNVFVFWSEKNPNQPGWLVPERQA